MLATPCVDAHHAVGGSLRLLAQLDHHEGHGAVDADERDDEEHEADDELTHTFLGLLGGLIELRGAHELLGVDGAIAVLVEHLQRGLYLVGEGRDGDGTLLVRPAQDGVSAEHCLELLHVEDSVAVGVDIREHGLDVLGERPHVDPAIIGEEGVVAGVAVGAGDVTEHAAGSAIPRRLASRWPIRSADGGWWFGLRRAAGALRVVSVRRSPDQLVSVRGNARRNGRRFADVAGVGEKHESHRKERTLLTERTRAVDVETTARRDFSRTALRPFEAKIQSHFDKKKISDCAIRSINPKKLW